MSVFDRRPPVKRYEHGSRVPGWDDAVDLTKPPATVPDPALTPVPEELRSAIEAAMAQYPDSKSASIPALHLAQEHHGWCSPEAITQVACVMRLTPAYLTSVAITQVACVMRLTPAYLTSVASFYDMFSLQPKPANDVYVCTNITCSLLGADEFYAEMIRAAEGHDSIGVRGFECLGACDIAPMASVNGEYVGPLNLDDAALIVEDLEAGRPVLEHKQLRTAPARTLELPVTKHLLIRSDRRAGLNTLAVYEQRGGYSALRKALAMPPAAIVEEISQSAIRGRGGAGFKMGQKASFLPKGDMAKYLVCNADESEPGTFKDRELMQKSPHTLLEGIIITTFATGIHHAFIYIRGEYVLQADILEAAMAEAEAAGYVGEDILGSGHSLKLVLQRGAGAYICGEETGLLDSLEGKRGNPRLKPPFPAIEGLYDGPTLVNNVETLGTVPTIINMGGAEYAKLGTEGSTGTKLVSVSATYSAPVTMRSTSAPPAARSSTGSAVGPSPGARSRCGSRAARARRCCSMRTSTRPTTSTRWRRPARCSAPARSSSSTTRTRRSRSRRR